MNIKDFFTKQNIELDKEISLYVCGPTVYNHPHIGNMRPIVLFDVFNRVASIKNKVTFVHNITDVDDKIIKASKDLNMTEKEVSKIYEDEYLNLLEKLNIKKPTYMPKVTENIDGMILFINELIEKGFAYESNGSVYFSVNDFNSYGKIDNLSLDKLIDNEVSDEKRDFKDFALWKKTKAGIKFNSPWSDGRPGWHTECAYFTKKYFGSDGIDVHGGGIDLKFPHHINEMAQYEALTGKPLAKAWSYVGHLTVDDVKMSKSKGNFVTANDFIKQYSANILRYILLSVNPLKPINLNDEVIKNSQNSLNKFINVLKKTLIDLSINSTNQLDIVADKKFVDYLEDNLDTTSALTHLMDMVKLLNNEKELERKEKLVGNFIGNLLLIGFDFEINFEKLRDKIKTAKENSDFVSLDKLREELIK